MHEKKHCKTKALLLVCILVSLFWNKDLNASGKPALAQTRVEIPWHVFDELREKKVDTIVLEKTQNPPADIIFNASSVAINIIDSIAKCTLKTDYTVLSGKRWSGVRLYDTAVSFSRVQCSENDYLLSTDSGFVLFGEARNKSIRRRLFGEWYVSSKCIDGQQELSIPLPPVSSIITVTVPQRFSNITIENYIVVSDVKVKGMRVLKCIAPSSSKSALIHYVLPHNEPSDVRDEPATDTVQEVTKEKKITSSQQSIIYVNSGNTTCLTALSLNAINTSLSTFNVKIPDGYSVLRVEGNGIKKWSSSGPDTIKIDLLFTVTDTYTVVLVMETESDTGGYLPSLDLSGATHQSGSFAIALVGSDEIIFTNTENIVPLSGADFVNGIKDELTEAISNLSGEQKSLVEKSGTLESATSGNFYKLPLHARYKIRHHQAVPVTNAIADSVTVVSYLTEDWKLITQVNYFIQQRNRKFITIFLPDTCDIWQIKINGQNKSPFVDEKRKIRIALSQNVTANNQMLELSLLYFTNLSKRDHIKLYAPVPDIPVKEISWLMFYDSKHRISHIGGDFTVTKGWLLKRRIQQSKDETRNKYESIRRTGREQKVPILQGTSPEHIYGKKLLVVNEYPALEMVIGKKSLALYWGILISGIMVAGFLLILKRRIKG